jgi:fatty-acyl-CoA synthase
MNSQNSERQMGLSSSSNGPSKPVLEWSVGDALRYAAGRYSGQVALVDGAVRNPTRRSWTCDRLLSAAERVAHSLVRRFRPGEHIAVWSNSSPEWLLLEFGAALAGLVLVTVNPAFQPQELLFVLRQSRSVACFAVRRFRDRDMLAVVNDLRSQLPDLRELLPLDDLLFTSVDETAPGQLPLVAPDEIAQIQYTSGTTGFPKGAMLTHRGLVNNARFYAETSGARAGDVWINPLPLFHTAGCGLVTLGALQTGGTHVLMSGFEPGTMLDLLESERGSITLSVPTMAVALLEQSDLASRDLSAWRLAALGGASVPVELVRRIEQLTSARVTIGFGQTEHCPYITHTRPDEPFERRAMTVGRTLPNTEVKIVEPLTGAILPPDTVGEICARGYAVMRGYFDDPETTARTIDANGWLHTGDLGSLDAHGYLSVRGRLKDMIIRGGENIYPREIEDVLAMHPDVADAAVVGVPDAFWGETVVAYVRPVGGASPDEAALFEHCRAHLAAFKTPRHWRFVDRFPQTASGKIQKYVLREQFEIESCGGGAGQ